MKAKAILLLNNTITQNPILARRAWFCACCNTYATCSKCYPGNSLAVLKQIKLKHRPNARYVRFFLICYFSPFNVQQEIFLK